MFDTTNELRVEALRLANGGGALPGNYLPATESIVMRAEAYFAFLSGTKVTATAAASTRAKKSAKSRKQ